MMDLFLSQKLSLRVTVKSRKIATATFINFEHASLVISY